MSTDKASHTPWVFYNPLTMSYDTRDGTKVATEVVDSACCLADVLRVAQIRANQRAAIAKAEQP